MIRGLGVCAATARRRGARTLAPALALALALSSAAAAAPRALGGVRLLEAMEASPSTLVAEVLETTRLDRSSYAARLRVETSLVGPLRQAGELRVAWEELSPSRQPRFAPGDRVLVSLERLPGASIWRERIPDDEARAHVLGVAQRGDAFLRQPSSRSVLLLEHYLGLGAEGRRSPSGVAYLVDLVAAGELPLARSAVDRLRAAPALDEALSPESAGRLAKALLRRDADPAFRAALVSLIGERALESTRPALEFMAAADPPPPPAVFEALAGLEGGIRGDRLEALLEEAPADRRRVAARHASGPGARDTLARLLRADPAPTVRAAAAERLGELGGDEVMEPLLRGLSDSEPSVRGVAARQLAGLGEPVVLPLRRVVDGNDPEAASAAVVALGLSGAPGARQALLEISASHQDEGLRVLADIALGRRIGHEH